MQTLQISHHFNVFYPNLRCNRISSEHKELVVEKDNEKLLISQAEIVSLFYSYYNAYSENDIESMTSLIQKLANVTKNQYIDYFPEFDQYNLSQLINESFYFSDELYHNSLLDFFQTIFQSDHFSFYDSFLSNGLFKSLLHSITIFPENEHVLLQSFKVIYEISQKNEEIFHQLLAPEFLNLFLALFRSEDISADVKINIASILNNSYLGKITKSGKIFYMRNLLLILRQIFEDFSLDFMWSVSFHILNLMITNKSNAEYIIIKKEFHFQCTQILLNSDSADIGESIINVFKSYFTHTPLLFDDIESIVNKIIQLVTENETLLYPALCFLNKFIQQGHLNILMDFDIFEFFKNYFQEGNYKIKKKILKAVSNAIRQLTKEEMIQIIIPLNFMEDFVQILCINDHHMVFDKFIGAIARLLRTHVDYDPPDVFWIQFEECCGVEIIEEISNGEDQEFAKRASRFLEKIYSLRPIYNNRE